MLDGSTEKGHSLKGKIACSGLPAVWAFGYAVDGRLTKQTVVWKMTEDYKPNPTDAQVKNRLKEFGRKHRKRHPVPPVDENEPDGLLVGDPKKFEDLLEEEFDDDFGEEKNWPRCR